MAYRLVTLIQETCEQFLGATSHFKWTSVSLVTRLTFITYSSEKFGWESMSRYRLSIEFKRFFLPSWLAQPINGALIVFLLPFALLFQYWQDSLSHTRRSLLNIPHVVEVFRPCWPVSSRIWFSWRAAVVRVITRPKGASQRWPLTWMIDSDFIKILFIISIGSLLLILHSMMSRRSLNFTFFVDTIMSIHFINFKHCWIFAQLFPYNIFMLVLIRSMFLWFSRILILNPV